MMSATFNKFTDRITTKQIIAETPVIFEPGMALADIEKFVILETLRHQRFNRTRTARILGIGIRTLQRKLKKYQEDETAGQPLIEDLSVS